MPGTGTPHTCDVHSSHAPQSLYRKRHRTVPILSPLAFLSFLFRLNSLKKASLQKIWSFPANIIKTNSKHILITLFFAVTSFIPLNLFSTYLPIFHVFAPFPPYSSSPVSFLYSCSLFPFPPPSSHPLPHPPHSPPLSCLVLIKGRRKAGSMAATPLQFRFK